MTSRATQPPLVRQTRRSGLPLSFAQERMWFLDQLDAGNTSNHAQIVRRLRGKLVVEALRRALEALVERHEVLRTTFSEVEGVPAVDIRDAVRWELPVEDRPTLPPDALQRLTGEEARRGFDLATGPLLRSRLIRQGEDEYVLSITVHHIASDGVSMAILWRELCALYGSFAHQQPAALPQHEVQYADFAAWQRSWLRDAELERQVAYWRQRLAGAPEEVALPFKGPRPATHTGRSGEVVVTLEADEWRSLRELGRRHRASPFMTLVAGFRALLGRVTRQDDICIGTPVSTRDRSVRELVGCFINTLALRTAVDRRAGFSALLEAERRTLFEALAHQQTPFEAVIDALGVERSLSRSPLLQVMVAWQEWSWDTQNLGGVTDEPLVTPAPGVQFDLEVNLYERDGLLFVAFLYDVDLFERDTVFELARAYRRLLLEVTADPARSLAEISLLSDDDAQRMVARGRGVVTAVDERPVHEVVAEQARRRVGEVAVVSGDASITYGELDRRANQLAHHLRELGVAGDVIVGLFLERSIDFVVASYASLKAGGAYLPLDPLYPTERLRFFLENARPAVLVTTAALRSQLPGDASRVVALDADATVIAARPTTPPAASVSPDNLSYVLYTSGSTGRPKGVATPHRGLRNVAAWLERVYDLGPADRGTQLSSVSFDGAVGEIWPLLCAGGCVYIVDDDLRLSPIDLWRALGEWGITICEMSVPLLEAAMSEGSPPASLRILRAASDRLVRRPPVDATYQLMNEYGLTETSVDCTWTAVGPAPAGAISTLPSIGRPLDNLAAYVLDRDLALVPAGMPGEFHVGGASLSRGYVGDPAQTAAKFIPDPFGPPGSRLYRSGDLMRWRHDGDLDFIGRSDEQVKVRGFRIELAEIEDVLARHPAVAQVVVLARATQVDKQLVAYVVASGDLDPSDLRRYAGDQLPDYMVPAAFVQLAQLPLTPNGKVDRRALPAPSEAAYDHDRYVAPRSPVEEVVAGIWSEILDPVRVGVHDDFFALGGHSLRAIQVVSRIRRLFGVEFSVRRLFETPTVAGLAGWLSDTIGPDQAIEEATLLLELASTPDDDAAESSS